MVRSVRALVLAMPLEKDTCVYSINLGNSDRVKIFNKGIDEEEEVPITGRPSVGVVLGCYAEIVINLRLEIVKYSDGIVKRDCWDLIR